MKYQQNIRGMFISEVPAATVKLSLLLVLLTDNVQGEMAWQL
jgi:hypothetical protein